ncbi:MAG: regulatory protein RecX [Oscillospiraceae bacterium]|nr:regulatory protein RecX [Oscillospiraceae bacterium]
MRIEEVKPSERKKGRFLVKLEDSSLLRVTEEELLRFGLRPGMELDEAQLEEIQASVKASSAKAAAANMIGSRALSKQELQRRLVRKGAQEADARAAADWLEDIGAVNDAAYAAVLVRHYGGKGYGAARVKEELRHRGVPRELWDEALEELPESAEILDALIQKKCRGDLSDPKELKRVSDGLLRRGFSWSEVRSALRRYAELEEE